MTRSLLSLKIRNIVESVKISKTIGLIARLRHIVPTCTLLNFYQSLITPYLTYGLISCGNACKTFLDQILVLQKRPLRLICFAETNADAIPFLSMQKFYLYSLYIMNPFVVLCMM